MMYLHYKYINPIRDSKYKLRPWEEYNWLSHVEAGGDGNGDKWTVLKSDEGLEKKHIFFEEENNK